MPAASALLRHAPRSHATGLQKPVREGPDRRLISKTTSYGSKLRDNLPFSLTKSSPEDDSAREKTNYTKRQYWSSGDRELMLGGTSSVESELHPANSVKTNVTTGPFGEHCDGKVHLRVDLEQG